ncbi:MAG: PEP-CTERM sorting domain-containing protein [Candidatus Competibacteraceae bacterium]|nr:PEP-CTERM sorting domain-containing protein [Candidatus Competibacteraceae bacterium]
MNSLLSTGSDWILHGASAINNAGQIIGDGIINGQQHAFLMSPIPEPTTFFLLGVGFVGLSFCWRSKNVKV